MKIVLADEDYCSSISATKEMDNNQTEARLLQKNKVDLNKIAEGVQLILEGIGEDSRRDGLLRTPHRVARMYQELFYGIGVDPSSEITGAFYEKTEELVLVKDISFVSICEHHLLPFIGIAHVGYIPCQGKIIGLSKLARVVELASKKLQVQERMTNQIADALMKKLNPLGAIVVLEAEHLCMSIRGIKKTGSRTVTSALKGVIETDKDIRAEIMLRIK